MKERELPTEPTTALLNSFALTNLRTKPANRVVLHINDSFLHWDDRVIGDSNMFRADFSTTFSDIAHSKSMLFLRLLFAVPEAIKWVHIKFSNADEESWTSK